MKQGELSLGPVGARFVYHHGHELKPHGHGGNRRARQIDELLRSGPFPVASVTDQLSGGLAWNLASGARGLASVHRAPWYRYLSLRGLKNLGIALRIETQMVRETPAIHLFDTHSCIYEWLIPALRQHGSKIVFVPQNIDALTPGFRHPISSKRAPHWLQDELSALSKADHVFTISREEQWLLDAAGICSTYLPYQPTRDVLAELEAIRLRRVSSTKDLVLILGSATNTPTLLGLRALARHSDELVKASGSRRVVVAGFGTEVIKHDMGLGVEVLGGVSASVLDDLMARADVCLAYQAGTSGVLTRVVELLIAGVPVIANPPAARSVRGVPGVRVVEDVAELLEVLAKEEFEPFTPEVVDLHATFWNPLNRIAKADQ